MARKKWQYKPRIFKKFLNRPGYHDLAAVRATLSVDGYGFHEGTISISDCRRTISLDLSCYDEGDFKNAIHKIEVLQATVDFMQAHLAESWEAAKEYKKNESLSRGSELLS